MTGTVVVSLDFELGWGHREIRPEYVEELRDEEDMVDARVRRLIDLFEAYELPATWAVVGKLLTPGSDPLFHNRQLFEALLDSTPDHEVGLHSHAHRPFDELSLDEARDDVEAGVEVLREWGVVPRSFVFPRNRVAHTDALRDHGFTRYRDAAAARRFRRIASAWFPDVVELPLAGTAPIGLPETLFLAARRPDWYLRRSVERSLERAASTDGLVHYWLHPHNVVTEPTLLTTLEAAFSQIADSRSDGAIEVRTMDAVDCSFDEPSKT